MLNIEPNNVENAKEILQRGQDTEFWKLICNALEDSIAHLQTEQDGDDTKDLLPEQYKLEMELLKAKRKYLDKLRKLPETLIAYFSEPSGNLEKDHNFDPYFNEEELRQELSKQK